MVHRTYKAADLEAMIEMLEQEPVLLGDRSEEYERTARYRAQHLRLRLDEYGIKVTSRTWPEITYNGDEPDVRWRWCVILKDQTSGRA